MRSGKFIKRLDIYIFRQILLALVLATGGLTALIWLTQSLRFIDLVVNRGLSLLVFLRLTGLLIPSFIVVILPITTYVVIQFTYQRMTTDRELTVMRAAGLSPWALARPALAVALLATCIGYGLSLWGVPASLSAFKQYQWEIRNRLAAFLLQDGVFTPLSDKLTVYVRVRDQDGTLHGILVDDARNPSAHATILAQSGRLLDGPNGPQVLLIDGSRQEIDHQTGRLDMLTFKQNEIDLSDATKDESARPADMSEVSLGALLDPHPYFERDKPKWLAEGYKRLTAPLTTMSYAMVALFSALGGMFRRHGGVLRPLLTVLTMVGLLALGLAFGTLAARDNALIFLLWVHALLPGLICAWLLFRPSLRLRQPRPAAARGTPGRAASMIAAVTLSLYIVRQFALSVVGMLLALAGLVSMFDFIELLRRSASHPEVGFGLVSQIAALRLPFEAIQILPFAVLLGGILCFWRLTRSSELIVARAAGISAWEFLTAPTLCALLFGVFATALLSPVSSVMLARAEALDNAYLQTGGGPLALNGGQLWLRQADRELTPKGVAIIHAQQVKLIGKQLAAQQVSVFRLDDQDRLLSRIEATAATLRRGDWQLDNARSIRPDQMPEPPRTLTLPTNLTVSRVQESFASPDTLSFWALPGFISLLDRSGFSSLRHRLHFQALLALPLLAATMTLVSAGFSMRPARRGGVAKMIGSGVAAGFALFVVSKVAQEIGQSGALPVVLAAWAPAASGLMLAIALLLHTEDG